MFRKKTHQLKIEDSKKIEFRTMGHPLIHKYDFSWHVAADTECGVGTRWGGVLVTLHHMHISLYKHTSQHIHYHCLKTLAVSHKSPPWQSGHTLSSCSLSASAWLPPPRRRGRGMPGSFFQTTHQVLQFFIIQWNIQFKDIIIVMGRAPEADHGELHHI